MVMVLYVKIKSTLQNKDEFIKRNSCMFNKRLKDEYRYSQYINSKCKQSATYSHTSSVF